MNVEYSHADVWPQKNDGPGTALFFLGGSQRTRSCAVQNSLLLLGAMATVLVRLAEGRVESTAPQTVPSTRLEIFIGSGSWSCPPPAHACLPAEKRSDTELL